MRRASAATITLLLSSQAQAQTVVDFGVTAGAVQIADTTRYAVTPQARVSLLTDSGWGITLRSAGALVIPQTVRDVLGVHISAQGGILRSWSQLSLDVSGAIAGYRVTACHAGRGVCGVVVGASPGATIAADYYFAWDGRVGTRVAASVWAYLGDAPAVADTWSVQLQAGLVVRLRPPR